MIAIRVTESTPDRLVRDWDRLDGSVWYQVWERDGAVWRVVEEGVREFDEPVIVETSS